MANLDELQTKEQRVRELMDTEGLDALAISGIGNFAWITCGGSNFVGVAAEVGVASAIITRDAKLIVCDNIESPRIRDEEVAGQGFEFATCAWYESNRDKIVCGITKGGVLGSDTPMEGAKNIASALDTYRYSLTPAEVERYRWLGTNTGECLAEAASRVAPGMSEYEAAAVLNSALLSRGITPLTTLIAADERISSYRHPIPTGKKIERYVMLITGARKWGLILSASRIVHFGEISPELRRKHDAVARVDAALITNTRIGTSAGTVFRKAMEAYESTGYPNEWMLHHQGGATGYKARDYKATPDTDIVVVANQAFAWNPSITGTKTEDTIIATADGPEIISEAGGWPTIEVEAQGITIRRPDIMVR